MKQFLWRLFQGSLVGLVVLANQHYGVINNPYLAVIGGFVIALFATIIINVTIELALILRDGLRLALRVFKGDKGLDDGGIASGWIDTESGESLRIMSEGSARSDKITKRLRLPRL